MFPYVQHKAAEHIDDTAAKAVKGVVKIVTLPSGVAVIAETIDAAMKAKGLLKVTWTKNTPAQTYDHDRVLQDYRAIAADWSEAGVEMVKVGDADAAVKGAAKVLSADYFSRSRLARLHGADERDGPGRQRRRRHLVRQ